MCETTIVSIFAFTSFVDKGCAKLGLVLVRVIEFFNPVVRFFAFLTLRAFPIFQDVLALFRLIRSKRSSLVLFLIMIKWAPF